MVSRIAKVFISLHAEVDANDNVLVSHDLIDNIEQDIKKEFGIELVIHMDPICVNDPEVKELKTKVSSYLHSLDEALSLHDFRIVKGPTHTNIIFDILMPYNFKYTDTEIQKLVSDYIKSLNLE